MQISDYAEWVPIGNLVKGIVSMFIALEIFMTFTILFFAGLSVDSIIPVGISLGILFLVGFLIWNYRGIRIQISAEHLIVDYGVFNKKDFQLEELTYCKRTRANLGRYFGIGIRYGFDGSIAYTTSFGDAVEVAPKAGKVFVFSSNHPEKVCKIIQKHFK
jgi:hypothetical protein